METESSLVQEIYYDDETLELTVHFHKYYVPYNIHLNVPLHTFQSFGEVKSIGRFYLEFVKPKYKLKTEIMSDKKRPETVNQCSDQKRFIKISINVRKINRNWIVPGETGDYLNITLQMLPNGDLDRFGNLGMITQDVPQVIVKQEKDLPKEQRSNGEILGNGAEFARKKPEGTPGAESDELISADAIDDLPF